MNQKSTPSIEAALSARIDALEKRIQVLESGARSAGESVSKRSVRLVRPEEEKAKAKEAVAGDDEVDKPAGDHFEIISVDSRAFERDEEQDRCKFSWKIVVENQCERPLILGAHLEFVDMDSYLVEEDRASGYRLDPGVRGKFRGYKWISNEAEYQIVGVRAHLTEEVVEAGK